MNSDEVLYQLSEMLCMDADSIQLELEPGCRCCSCYHYVARDCDGELVASGGSLQELAEYYKKGTEYVEGE